MSKKAKKLKTKIGLELKIVTTDAGGSVTRYKAVLFRVLSSIFGLLLISGFSAFASCRKSPAALRGHFALCRKSPAALRGHFAPCRKSPAALQGHFASCRKSPQPCEDPSDPSDLSNNRKS
jgi:hypothetical protein